MVEATTRLPVKKSPVPERVEARSPLESLRREIDRLFEDVRMPDWPSRLFGVEVPRLSRSEWQISPAIDVVEQDDSYQITAELPGVDERSLDIKLSNHTLTIKGEKSEQMEDRQKEYYLSERRYGAFQRSFPLPDGVDTDKIEASFAKGILTVKLPKTAEAKKAEKKIAVKAA